MPDNFDAARQALSERFPRSPRRDRSDCSDEMEHIASAMGTLSQGSDAFRNSPREALRALLKLLPASATGRCRCRKSSIATFGDNEAVKCALAANLSYYHDDPATLWWMHFAMAQGSYLQSGGRFVQGGSQRLSSALARAIRSPAAKCWCAASSAALRWIRKAAPCSVTHTAKDGSDPQVVECVRLISNAAPAHSRALMPEAAADATDARLCGARRRRSRCSR